MAGLLKKKRKKKGNSGTHWISSYSSASFCSPSPTTAVSLQRKGRMQPAAVIGPCPLNTHPRVLHEPTPEVSVNQCPNKQTISPSPFLMRIYWRPPWHHPSRSLYLFIYTFPWPPIHSITVHFEHSRTATMGEDKTVTTMVLKVDLQCQKCYKKVKKILCKFPQIRDQMYDEKNNQVTIKVVSCSPEKFRDKLCCKGRCVIKSIEIIKPPPPKPTPAPDPPKPPKPTPDPPKPPKPTPDPPKSPPRCTCRPLICRCRPVICRCPPMICRCPPVICTCPPVICTCLPAPPPVKCPRPPVNTCCRECSGGHPGWPCQIGHGCGVLCPCIQYVCYCGRPGFDCYCVTRPNCFIEENSPACAIM